MKNLDCRGLACPGPVIQVKKALGETVPGASFSIELDSEASRDNVLRFVNSRGADVRSEETTDGTIRLVVTAPDKPGTEMREPASSETSDDKKWDVGKQYPVVLITSKTLGRGDDKLGGILMEGFISTLPDQDGVPDQILLMNGAVRLVVEGSQVLGSFKKLTDLGCEILVCSTCLDFFGLMDKLEVGTVSNMYDIQRALLNAGDTVRV